MKGREDGDGRERNIEKNSGGEGVSWLLENMHFLLQSMHDCQPFAPDQQRQ